MLISYNRPSDIAWSLIGDGSAWLSDDAGAALVNGRPAAASRLQWLSGAQTTASILILRGTWGTAIAPRVVGLVGVTLPVGTLIRLAFRRPADAGYTYLADIPQQRVVLLPDGSRCAWFVLDDGLDPVIGVEFHMVNDVNGAASITAGATVDLGEAWVGPTVEIPHEAGWSRGIADPSVLRRSKGSQLFASPQRSWRTLQVQFSPDVEADVRGDGLDGGSDWEQIEAALLSGAPCAAVPRWRGQTADYLQRTAMLMAATKQDDIQHAAGSYYSRNVTFEELPA